MRLIAQLEELGYIPTGPMQRRDAVQPEVPPCSSPSICTFQGAVDIFRATKAITKLKRATRRS